MKTAFLCNSFRVQCQLARYLSAALLLALSVGARAQTIAQDVVIDDHFPVGEPLEIGRAHV